MTTSTSLNYWKHGNVFFVPPVDGAAEQPAMVFKGLPDLQSAMRELFDISVEDPLRQALLPPSEAAETSLRLEILELIVEQTPEKECLVWLDRSHEPRVEWLGDRSCKTAKEGFRQWLSSLDLTLHTIPDSIFVLKCILKNQVKETKNSTSSSDTHATAPTAAPVVNEQKPASVASTTSAASTAMQVEKATEEESETPNTAMGVEKSPEEAKTATGAPMEIENTTNDTTAVQAETNPPKPALESMDVEEAPKTQVAGASMPMAAVQNAEQTSQEDEMEHSVPTSVKKNRKTAKARPAPARVSIEPTTERPRRSRGKAPEPPAIAEQRKDEEFESVGDYKAKKLLQKAGFQMKKRFSLPGNEESFLTLEDMQVGLRRNGIPNFPGWTPEERLEVEKWVRQSIYRTGKFPNKLSVQSEISNYKDLMNIAGFQWKSCGLYNYPHVESGSARQDAEFCFSTERELMESLARNGLPDYLYDDGKLTEEELLAIEYYTDTVVYLPAEPKNRRNLFVREWIESNKRNRDDDSDEQDTASLSSTLSKKKARATPSKGKHARSTPSKGKNSPPAKSKKVTPTKLKKQSPAKSRAIAADDPSTPTTAVTMATVEASVDVLPWPPVMDPVEEIKGNSDWERLNNAQAALSKAADKPVFAESSSLAKKLKLVQDMVHAVVRSTGRHGGEMRDGEMTSSKALYVCGVPGTGKTLSVSWICNHVLKLQKDGDIGVERDDDDNNVHWRFLLQNANSVRNADTFRENTANELGVKPRILAQTLKRQGLILVVDEIDSMLTNNEMKSLLQKLLEYANDDDMRFALIGISNSLMDEKFEAVKEAGNFQKVVTFSAYSESDLLTILHHRVGYNLMEDKAKEMIAKKCYRDKGDARTALDLAASVVKTRLESLDEDSGTLTDGPLIKVPHVVAVSQKQNRGLVDRIAGLPQACKLCLVVLISLGKKQVTESTIGKVYGFVAKCLSFFADDEGEYLSSDDFERCLETLVDSSLLRLGASNLNNLPISQKVDVKICLGLQLEDVQIAVDKVCQGELYQKVAKLASDNTPELE
eukprot:scaffold2069_cov187-Amphora_coffeaeformis.AAC.17